ncbi:MAG: 30S ribosomal protein S13 [Candidatus Tectomicrobia bacterium]|nr:30S ribosomal protein S13 [Candidatus Tectomicrobia bacterium]
MARIAGVDVPNDKQAETALTYIFGVGRSIAKRILAEADINPQKRIKDFTDQEIAKVRTIIEQRYTVEGDLRREVTMNIKRLMDIGTYCGLRHRRGLPVHGQRTRTNSRTRKGPRRTVGARGKKK